MRRFRTGAPVLVVLLVLSGAIASSASATGLDWAVNGTPLAEGKSIPVKIEALTATTISSPGAGITFVCQKLTGKETLVGGKEGTGTGVIKISKCVVSGEPNCHVGTFTVPNNPHPDYYLEKLHVNPDETTSYNIHEHEALDRVSKCPHEGSYELAGLVDGEVSESNEAEYLDPESALEASDLTINGKPAVWSGAYRIKPPGKDKFGYREL